MSEGVYIYRGSLGQLTEFYISYDLKRPLARALSAVVLITLSPDLGIRPDPMDLRTVMLY